jgi:hypothetical protein
MAYKPLNLSTAYLGEWKVTRAKKIGGGEWAAEVDWDNKIIRIGDGSKEEQAWSTVHELIHVACPNLSERRVQGLEVALKELKRQIPALFP